MVQLEFPMEKGKKFDTEKIRLDLLPVGPLKEVAKVLTHGAAKYGPRNWERGIEWSRVYRAALGHLMDFWEGEDVDPDTGDSRLLHLAEAACNILFLLQYFAKNKKFDDRPGSAHGTKTGNGGVSEPNGVIPQEHLELSNSDSDAAGDDAVAIDPRYSEGLETQGTGQGVPKPDGRELYRRDYNGRTPQ